MAHWLRLCIPVLPSQRSPQHRLLLTQYTLQSPLASTLPFTLRVAPNLHTPCLAVGAGRFNFTLAYTYAVLRPRVAHSSTISPEMQPQRRTTHEHLKNPPRHTGMIACRMRGGSLRCTCNRSDRAYRRSCIACRESRRQTTAARNATEMQNIPKQRNPPKETVTVSPPSAHGACRAVPMTPQILKPSKSGPLDS